MAHLLDMTVKTYGNKWFRAQANTIRGAFWSGKVTQVKAYLQLRALGFSHADANLIVK
jgi:hypothetical protein